MFTKELLLSKFQLPYLQDETTVGSSGKCLYSQHYGGDYRKIKRVSLHYTMGDSVASQTHKNRTITPVSRVLVYEPEAFGGI